MSRTLIGLVMSSIFVIGLAGQAPPIAPPSAEHQRLGAFVGNWTSVGEMKPGPMGPGGKMAGTDRIQWLPGNFAIERRFEGKGPMGSISGLEVIAYDTAKKSYTYTYVDNTGAVGGGTVTTNGPAWMFTGNGSMGGKTMHERCTLTFGAGNATLKIACQVSGDGKSFAPMYEGNATKTK
jgi:hypothetical protein